MGTALAAGCAGALGLLAGLAVARAAQQYVPVRRSPGNRDDAPVEVGVPAPQLRDRREDQRVAASGVRVPRPLPELATGLLFALTTLRFGVTWQLPAFLVLAAVGVLLTVVDLRHKLLPNRFVLPSLGIGAALLAVAAAAGAQWPSLVRAVLAAVVLFAVYLVMALIAPGGLGMGDVKLAALLGLHLGWLGWGAVLTGAVAGFVVQAALALVLLATRRIGLRGELPFGPAMLVGAAIAMAAGGDWTAAVLSGGPLL